MAKDYRDKLFGENYKYISGIPEFIEGLRKKDPAAADEFIQNISQSPTAYYKLFENMIAGEDLPLFLQNRSKVRFVEKDDYQLNIRKRMTFDKFDATDMAKITCRIDSDDIVIPNDPYKSSMEFDILVGDMIMDEVENEIKEKTEDPRKPIDFAEKGIIISKNLQQPLENEDKASREKEEKIPLLETEEKELDD